jgi:hypothetical protein
LPVWEEEQDGAKMKVSVEAVAEVVPKVADKFIIWNPGLIQKRTGPRIFLLDPEFC